MHFWRGKIWVFMALLALCGPFSPLVARVCAMENWTNSAIWNCAAPPIASENQFCCCESPPVPFFGSIAAPLPTSQQDFGVYADDGETPRLVAILAADFHLETPHLSVIRPISGLDPPLLSHLGCRSSGRGPPSI